MYYLHKAVVATVGVLTRRMPKRSHAVEQARMMLHGSLLTWSFALAAAHLTVFLSSAASPTHSSSPASSSSQSTPYQYEPADSDDWANVDNATGAAHNSNNAWWVTMRWIPKPSSVAVSPELTQPGLRIVTKPRSSDMGPTCALF